MRVFIIIAFILTINSLVKGQFIDNKLNIQVSYCRNFQFGDTLVADNNFKTPSLFNNYQNSNGYSIKAIYKIKNRVNIGVAISSVTYNKWRMLNYDNFLNSNVTSLEFKPFIQYHPFNSNKGILNYLQFSLQFSPIIGNLSVSLKQPLFEFVTDSLYMNKLNLNYLAKGIEISGGLMVIISNSTGLLINYGQKMIWINSAAFCDKHFGNQFLEFGLYFRFLHDKRFLYN